MRVHIPYFDDDQIQWFINIGKIQLLLNAPSDVKVCRNFVREANQTNYVQKEYFFPLQRWL